MSVERDVLEQIRHVYVSTACLHAVCEECRLECKFCEAPCQHECHEGGE